MIADDNYQSDDPKITSDEYLKMLQGNEQVNLLISIQNNGAILYDALNEIAVGDGLYGAMAYEYKDTARKAVNAIHKLAGLQPRY